MSVPPQQNHETSNYWRCFFWCFGDPISRIFQAEARHSKAKGQKLDPSGADATLLNVSNVYWNKLKLVGKESRAYIYII